MLVTTRVVRSIFHRGLQLNYGRSPARRRLVYRAAARGRELKIGRPRLKRPQRRRISASSAGEDARLSGWIFHRETLPQSRGSSAESPFSSLLPFLAIFNRELTARRGGRTSRGIAA